MTLPLGWENYVEIKDARKGKVTLKDKIDEIDTYTAELVTARGGKDNLNQRLNETDSRINDIEIIPLGLIENEDITTILSMAIDNAPVGSKIKIPKGTYLFNTTKIINKSIHLVSDGATLKTTTNGFDIFFSFQNTSNFSISGISFDDNLKGRTCIDVGNCSEFTIEKCSFTGYSAEFAYYQTDSAIRLRNCKKAWVKNNLFDNFGNQYGTDLATLNRCVSVNDVLCEDIYLIDNIINEVNQAFVIGGKNIIIANNIMNGVHDNCLYILGASNVLITGNNFRNKNDESIVLSGTNIIVDGNHICDSPNKAIAINGNSTNIKIVNNVFDNTNVAQGQFVVYRDMTESVDILYIKNNTFIQPSNNTTYGYFGIGNVTNFVFESNLVKVKTDEYQKVIYFEGTTAKGKIENNSFIGTDITATAVKFNASVTTVDMLFNNNELNNIRSDIGSMVIKNQRIQTNVLYINRINTQSIFWTGEKPVGGTWKKGDIAYNDNPLELGTAGNKYVIVGWECLADGTPGTWVDMRYLTGN